MKPDSTSAEVTFRRQLEEAVRLRELAYSVVEGKHEGKFERRDYIALSLFSRCLQMHQATEIVVRHSLVDDAWVLVRALVEHAVNCVYMLWVADAQVADDFADYSDYLSYTALRDLMGTDEALVHQVVSAEEEEEHLRQFEKVRSRFEGKRGDKWCVDDALYKRAARVDRIVSNAANEPRSDFLWLVNSAWRYASTYTHGTAHALGAQIREVQEGVILHRKYTHQEAAQALHSANLALYLVLLPVDSRLGGKHEVEIKRRLERWSSAIRSRLPQRTNGGPDGGWFMSLLGIGTILAAGYLLMRRR